MRRHDLTRAAWRGKDFSPPLREKALDLAPDNLELVFLLEQTQKFQLEQSIAEQSKKTDRRTLSADQNLRPFTPPATKLSHLKSSSYTFTAAMSRNVSHGRGGAGKFTHDPSQGFPC